MGRITKRDLQGSLAGLRRAMGAHGIDTSGWVLGTWSPGDGATRYRVEDGGDNPLGGRYWLGAAEAYEGLWLAIRVADAITDAKRES